MPTSISSEKLLPDYSKDESLMERIERLERLLFHALFVIQKAGIDLDFRDVSFLFASPDSESSFVGRRHRQDGCDLSMSIERQLQEWCAANGR